MGTLVPENEMFFCDVMNLIMQLFEVLLTSVAAAV